jgi:hypothetical protein
MTDIAQLHRELVTRVLESSASAPAELRRSAFDNAGLDDGLDDAGLDEPMRTLVSKVVARSYAVTDEDVAAVADAGLSENQIFEIVVCAAIGAADRQYAGGLAALTEAIGGRR